MSMGHFRWLLAALVAGGLLSLGGCAAKPGDDGPRAPTGADDDIPARSHHTPRGPVVDPKTSGALTLGQLLRYAEAHAPALEVARSQAEIGDAEVDGADVVVPYNPQVGVTAGGRTTGGVTRFELGVDVEQRIELAGERGTRMEAAARSRDARRAAADVAGWEIHVTVHALFYRLLVRRQQLAAAAKLEAFTALVRATIDKRVAAGEDSPLETIVANAELAKASQQVINARQAYRVTALHLAEVVGWPSAIELKVSGSTGPPKLEVDPKTLTKQALREHPSRRWLMLEVRAAAARVEREDREANPEPSIGLHYGREAETGSVSHVWTGTLSVPIPIWQRNQGGRARARADLGVAKAQQHAFEVALGARIAGAVVRAHAAAERVQLFGSDILPAFETNLDKLKRAFELGEISVLELAQIQERILVTQKAALDALEDYYDAVAAVEALSGVDILTRLAAKP